MVNYKTIKKANKLRKKTLNYIIDNPFCERSDIMEDLGYTKRFTKTVVEYLLKDNKIISVNYTDNTQGQKAKYYVNPKYLINNNIV